MARTWPETFRNRAIVAAFDVAARPAAAVLFRSKLPERKDVGKILVIELWQMGDVVLATSVLQSLRSMYPAARITLLAKSHAVDLLAESSLADDIICVDFPWTALTKKYNPGRYDRDAISAVMKKLKAEQFDLSLDARMDFRVKALARMIGVARRVGYAFGGGGFLLTDAVEGPPPDQHKVDDWAALLEPLRESAPGPVPPTPDPKLVVSREEHEEAGRLLDSHEVDRHQPLVGIHVGGSYENKRWPSANFAEVATEISRRHGARLLVFVDPDGRGAEMQLGPHTVYVRTTIREMMALLTRCDLLLCNDSGPMHIAAALGIPVVAVFRTGNPNGYGPRGASHAIVGAGAEFGKSCDVAVEDVLQATDVALASRHGISARNG